jgi:hypothetical protein
MSWSIQFVGAPDKVVAALEAQSEKFNGQSKVEYDDAKPHLIALVQQNFVAEGEDGFLAPLVRLQANGSGSALAQKLDQKFDPPKQIQRSMSVHLESIYGVLVS